MVLTARTKVSVARACRQRCLKSDTTRSKEALKDNALLHERPHDQGREHVHLVLLGDPGAGNSMLWDLTSWR